MSDLDLTAAVEAAARALHTASTMQRREWDRLPSRMVLAYRHTAAPIVEAAAPILAAQARQLGVPSTLSPGMRMTVTTLFARTPWQEVPDADA